MERASVCVYACMHMKPSDFSQTVERKKMLLLHISTFSGKLGAVHRYCWVEFGFVFKLHKPVHKVSRSRKCDVLA